MFRKRSLVCNSRETSRILTKEIILIEVSAYWMKRNKSWNENKIREYVGPYHGSWEIKCKGHREINGGFHTPDMMALFPTPNSIKKNILNKYQSRYPNCEIKIKLKITHDDRNPTMESFL